MTQATSVAALMDGALDGLRRLAARECIAAGLHIPEAGENSWNVAAVGQACGDQPVALIEWAKRARGLMFRPGIGRSIKSLKDVRGLRFQARQPESGSEQVLTQLLEQEGLSRADLDCVDADERSETDLAMAIKAGRADAGLGIEASARQFQLEFRPLIVERFDLLVWRQAYFEPPFQKLLRFCASEPFAGRAEELGGYDMSGLEMVRYNGP